MLLNITSALYLAAILQSEITNKKHADVKSVALKLPTKKTLVYMMKEMKQKGRVPPCSLSTEYTPLLTMSLEFGITNKFQ